MVTAKEIAALQDGYDKLDSERRLTKKAICDLCIPFRDKAGISDSQTLAIARREMHLSQILEICPVADVPDLDIEVRIDRLTAGEKKVKAYASATIGGAFAIHGLRIIETEERQFFVAMPQTSYKKDGETKYTDTFHAVTADARSALLGAVAAAYEKAVAERNAE